MLAISIYGSSLTPKCKVNQDIFPLEIWNPHIYVTSDNTL